MPTSPHPRSCPTRCTAGQTQCAGRGHPATDRPTGPPPDISEEGTTVQWPSRWKEWLPEPQPFKGPNRTGMHPARTESREPRPPVRSAWPTPRNPKATPNPTRAPPRCATRLQHRPRIHRTGQPPLEAARPPDNQPFDPFRSDFSASEVSATCPVSMASFKGSKRACRAPGLEIDHGPAGGRVLPQQGPASSPDNAPSSYRTASIGTPPESRATPMLLR